MKFAALISGGKDSTFNILECLNQGHELIATINLCPPSQCGKDELDSFMYQSVGHEAIDYISNAIGSVPLYRSEINGTAVTTALQYSADTNQMYDKNDEVEDLFNILSAVKQRHPDLQAIGSGAILSNYQRTRVENVCSRLGLISLAFMWQRSQVELLQTMIRCRMDPIIIKIAALGLSEQGHLGRQIRLVSDDIIAKSYQYGLNPCGEGGEYETLTLDAPYFQKRIEIDASRVVTIDDNDWASVKYLKIEAMRLVDKLPGQYATSDEFYSSPLREELALATKTNLDTLTEDLATELAEIGQHNRIEHNDEDLPSLRLISASACVHAVDECAGALKLALEDLELQLAAQGSTRNQIVYVLFCLPDMGQFAAANVVYASFFSTLDSPPGRTCITTRQTDRISLHCFLIGVEQQRTNMHIQSMSHWAPASIGPYSQAVALGTPGGAQLCLLSGQIALNPEDSSLIDTTAYATRDVELECLMSLRHVTRVAWVHAGFHWSDLACMVCYCVNGPLQLTGCRKVFHAAICGHQCLCKRVRWVTVRALPKGANVEWQAIFANSNFLNISNDELYRDNSIHLSTSHDIDTSKASIAIDSYLGDDDSIMSGFIRIDF